ncbi:hypothetical protein [Shewanella waksmanii]|uniref:hypothetical protein n=1 Tax=Shewanella waksmanii TaxID=213783 RepID=UPI003734DC96
MPGIENSAVEQPLSKLKLYSLGSFLLCATVFGLYAAVTIFMRELQNIDKIENGFIYIANKDMAVGFIFSIPFLVIFGYMILFIVIGKFREEIMKLLIKTAVVCMPLIIISTIMYSFWIGSELRAHGYSHCTWYDSPTRGTPVIWVKSDRYCQERAVYVEYDLLKQLDHYDNIGTEPSDEELDTMIIELLENDPFYRREHGISDLKKRQPL